MRILFADRCHPLVSSVFVCTRNASIVRAPTRTIPVGSPVALRSPVISQKKKSQKVVYLLYPLSQTACFFFFLETFVSDLGIIE